MNIGMFGVYSESSLGDHYLLDGIINQFREIIGENVQFSIFSHSPSATRNMLRNDIDRIFSATPIKENQSTGDNDMSTTQGNKNNLKSLFKRNLKRLFDEYPNLWASVDPLIMNNWAFWKKTYNTIKNLDLFIFGGGNIVMDLYPYSCVYHFLYSKLSEWAETPTMYYSIGAGPLRSKRAKLYYGKSIEAAQALTTRDEESLKLINSKINVDTPMALAADPAVYINKEPSDHSSTSPKISNFNGEERHIGVSVVPYYMEGYWPSANDKRYRDYVDTMSRSINNILNGEETKITFFATNYPSDLKPAKDISKCINDIHNVNICEMRLDSSQLLHLLDSFDVVLCTRLHSLIPTFVSNTPFIAYSYQPKVKYFCKRLGLSHQVIDLNNPTDDIIKDTQKSFSTTQQWGNNIPAHTATLSKIRKESLISTKIAKNLL